MVEESLVYVHSYKSIVNIQTKQIFDLEKKLEKATKQEGRKRFTSVDEIEIV